MVLECHGWALNRLGGIWPKVDGFELDAVGRAPEQLLIAACIFSWWLPGVPTMEKTLEELQTKTIKRVIVFSVDQAGSYGIPRPVNASDWPT